MCALGIQWTRLHRPRNPLHCHWRRRLCCRHQPVIHTHRPFMNPTSDKPRILIVEDDLDLSDMLDAYFRVQNYDVLTAAWGRDAIKIGAEETINLIMLDIRLPDINGYEVCRQLRTQRKTQDVPIIFLTEKRDRVDRLQGLELGVVDYITKPFDIQELRLRVRN